MVDNYKPSTYNSNYTNKLTRSEQMKKNKAIKKYQELQESSIAGQGRTISLALKSFSKEELFEGLDYAFHYNDISMKNCMIMGIAFKKNNITN